MGDLRPHFDRRANAPVITSSDYRAFREYVREDFRRTCAYCLVEELWAAGNENYEIDHFRPKSRFPSLRLSCTGHVTSAIASNTTAGPSGRWRGKTLAAEYTIDTLRLNRPHLVELRVFLRERSAL